ncbi:hypothetical protein LCGC14_1250850 [marine sediment metagenome]|uniref:Uncharacterized protein n=1 Tax=marine sediment metagenome TaxID=412755 RepID=A0A0F9NK81_9ZZZZ
MSRKLSRAKTKKKRQSQQCKVYEIKVDKSKLSKNSLHHLNMVFVEAKWLYNHVLTQEDITKIDTTILTVPVKVKDGFQKRAFKHISAQMKQSVKDRTFINIIALSTLKKRGHKVGRLKFKSELNSVPLKQYGHTYSINRVTNTVKLQKLKRPIKVRGLGQIPLNSEIANAMLVKRSSNYYFQITTYSTKEEKVMPNKSIGIDFGCETQLTLSSGMKMEYVVPVSDRIKKLDRKIMKNDRKRSNNKKKDQVKRVKAYQKVVNKKKDKKNKIVHYLVNNFKYICFQDENIKGWQASGHGKKIQNTAIGGIISDLKKKSRTPLVVSKWFPSTQLCPDCGHKYKPSLDERVYHCSACSYENDRDVKSAIMIEREGLKNLLPTDRRKVTPEDMGTSGCIGYLGESVQLSFCG